MNEPPHPVLAQGKVRHVGDPVALVVAETAHQAKDAAEADRRRLRGAARGGELRRRAEARRAAGPRQAPATSATRGRSATRRRWTRHSPRRRTWRSSTSSTTGSFPTRSSRARRSRRTTAPRGVHAVCVQPESARRAAADDGVRAGAAGDEGARHRARRRRRVRLQDLPLRRGRRRSCGRAST